ncbi:MAG: beta-propeller fold lactonase family protein [Oscillibacter sp.]|nr:beta-propeller fold lactonase family protein [Oscillibacter sp.]
MRTTIYAGTYAEDGSEGLYVFDFEEGRLSPARALCPIRNAKYLTVTEYGIAALCDLEGRSGAALVGFQGEVLSQAAYEGCTSCFVTADQGVIYTANYHEGTVSRLALRGRTLEYRDTTLIREKAGCHQILRWKDRILVPCLFLDQVRIFDSSMKPEGSIGFPLGTGPRHGVFSADGRRLYLVSELSNELFVISTGDWTVQFRMSILPGGMTHRKDTAAVRLSGDERRLYVSTRTLDLLSVVDLDGDTPRLIQTISCGGQHPRDFILLGNWLLAANRFSGTVVSFALNGDGTIGEKIGEADIPGVVCLAVRQTAV